MLSLFFISFALSLFLSGTLLYMSKPLYTSHTGSLLLRRFRKLHRQIAVVLFLFFIVIAVTGLMLGWKKNAVVPLLPPTQKGVTSDVRRWLPLDSLQKIAVSTLHSSVSPALSSALDRIDARPQKGTVKFLFADDYWEVQLDGTTGAVLSVRRRYSDLVEQIHDGTILDRWFGTGGDPFKVSYTTVMGLSLLTLTVTGIWLWYGPKRIRRKRRQQVKG
jgi:uncharacterized iron-regulated membrane protein